MINPPLEEMLQYLNSYHGHTYDVTLRKMDDCWEARHRHSRHPTPEEEVPELGRTRGEAILNLYERVVCNTVCEEGWYKSDYMKARR